MASTVSKKGKESESEEKTEKLVMGVCTILINKGQKSWREPCFFHVTANDM